MMKNSDAETPLIREALITDLAPIVRIYNYYILNTAITFEVAPHTPDTRDNWFRSFSTDGPYRLLVAEIAGSVMGYACSVPFKERAAYRTSVETSIYLAPGWTGRGYGLALYHPLMELLQGQTSLHRVYAGITLPNPASEALHRKLGFNRVGVYEEVGFKLNRFWDVAMYQKNLDSPGRKTDFTPI